MPTLAPYNCFDRYRRAWAGLCVSALAAVIVAAPGTAADEAVDRLQRDVARYVPELASPLRSERVRAKQALLKLGPRILDLLPNPDETPQQATRIAVRQIRIRLERVAAEQSVRPSRVTLRGHLTVADVAAHVERQTGNRIDVGQLKTATSERSIDVDWEDIPFWESLAQLRTVAKVDWEHAADDAAVRLIDPGASNTLAETAADNSQAFHVAIESFTRKRGTLRASLQLTGEPRLRPLFVRIADADSSARTGDEPLSLFNPQAVTELPMSSRGPARFSVLFQAPDEDSASAATVRGQVQVHLAAAPTEVRFDDLSGKRAVYLRRGGVSVRLKQAQLKQTPDGSRELTAQLAVAYDRGGPEFESHRTWIYHNECRLERGDGTQISPEAGFEITRQANGGVELRYRFSDLPDATLRDWQLVYVAPMLLIDVPVEFEFENVPVESARSGELSDESR